MGNQATVTSKIGPALVATSIVLTNVTDIDFQLANFVVKVVSDQGTSYFDLYATTTVTYTIATRVATIAVSQ